MLLKTTGRNNSARMHYCVGSLFYCKDQWQNESILLRKLLVTHVRPALLRFGETIFNSKTILSIRKNGLYSILMAKYSIRISFNVPFRAQI